VFAGQSLPPPSWTHTAARRGLASRVPPLLTACTSSCDRHQSHWSSLASPSLQLDKQNGFPADRVTLGPPKLGRTFPFPHWANFHGLTTTGHLDTSDFFTTSISSILKMSVVTLLGVEIKNNPAKFTDKYELEITFECLEPLEKGMRLRLRTCRAPN
jgi:hypothetical protein